MFFIFNKQKIYSYIVAASTVAILFVLSFFFINTDISNETKELETSSNIIKQNNNIIETKNNINTNNLNN